MRIYHFLTLSASASSNARKKAHGKNEVRLRWSELPQWIPG